MTAPLIEASPSQPCAICGAAVSAFRCGYCGFCSRPQPGPIPSPAEFAADVVRPLRASGLRGGQGQILVLAPGDDLAAALAALPVFLTMNITCLAEDRLPPKRLYDCILAGRALLRAGDVNRLMAGISAGLPPRGLMVADVTGERFDKNSLQILLERHGFRLAPRPLGWRLLNWFRRRVVARKL